NSTQPTVILSEAKEPAERLRRASRINLSGHEPGALCHRCAQAALIRSIPYVNLRSRMPLLRSIAVTLEMIKWEHSVFALPFALTPVALAVILLYSYTKRFTRWSHLVLGLALGIAPAAAWIAVRGALDMRILVLTGAVVFWVAGFDVLYSCQDYEFDSGADL